MDSRLLMALRSYTHCRFLDLTMPWVTYLGDGLVLFILCLATYLLGDKHGKSAAVRAIKALVLSGVAVQVVKHIVERPRPFGGSLDSFPSGHATVIFALAQVYGLEYRRLRLLFLALAALVGFSRLYVGMHYPIDVLAGGAMGLIVATVLLNHEKAIRQREQHPPKDGCRSWFMISRF
ncbi:MAG: phosphatase PAP2 family protein [Firmicutes bacterium]|nr:phosphatase PAP2 family protein [Bacillota bacterium]